MILYSFDLDKDHCRPDHLGCARSTAFSISVGCTELAPYYSHTGRPSIDPVLMIRMLLVGYVFAIRSRAAAMRRGSRSLPPTAGFGRGSVLRTGFLIPIRCSAGRGGTSSAEQCVTPGVRGCGCEVHCGRSVGGEDLLGGCEPMHSRGQQDEAVRLQAAPADCRPTARKHPMTVRSSSRHSMRPADTKEDNRMG